MGINAEQENANITIAAWINSDDAVSAGSEDTIASMDCTVNATNRNYQFRVQADNRIVIFIFLSGVAGSGATSSIDSLTPGSWDHVAGTWDSDVLRAYVNGVADGTEDRTNVGMDNDGPPFAIGARQNDCNYPATSSTIEFFDGQISEVCLWSEALTANEIAIISSSKTMRTGCQMQPSVLIDCWALDECADGVSCDGDNFVSYCGSGNNDGTGDDGAGNDNLTGEANTVLTYP